mmetsp:Transcript_65690/g.154574  ORF Transcript_65690/g.154574 Transcript_65690/m.154574 type:complete len:278 (-) Transcript_65690:125-958(-)
MSKALIYRFTFIDVDDVEEDVGGGMKKSASLPAISSAFDLETEAHMSETQQREYVNSLPIQAVAPPPPALPPNNDEEEDAENGEEVPIPAKTPAAPLWPSLGAVGHPELCSRPCVHYVAGRCAEGYNCGYCHMEHELNPKLDKLQRGFVQELSAATLLATMLPRLEARAEASPFAEQFRPVLGLVQAKLAELGTPEPGSNKKLKNLSKAMAKMSLSNLLKLAGRPPVSAPIATELRQALEDLREKLRHTPPPSQAASGIVPGGHDAEAQASEAARSS